MNFRAFISIDIDASPRIVEFFQRLKRLGPSFKVVNPDLIHVTLKFLGETEEGLIPKIRRAMERSVAGIGPMLLKLKKAGAFPGDHNMRVIWIGIEGGEGIGLIARNLDSELSVLGFKRDNRPFVPHITITRVREGASVGEARELLRLYNDVFFGEQLIDTIRLKKSILGPEGPTYSTVEDLKLTHP
jgi:2'-5' RNA ligase